MRGPRLGAVRGKEARSPAGAWNTCWVLVSPEKPGSDLPDPEKIHGMSPWAGGVLALTKEVHFPWTWGM